ncbi:MAG: hypothetical protein DHS20C07_22380 [Methyloligella sp.]|nr:MAG: hypothetical protein DHS20C07_22380 [Methyloligella sp.]
MEHDIIKIDASELNLYRKAIHVLVKRSSYKEITNILNCEIEYLRNFIRGKNAKTQYNQTVKDIIEFVDQAGGLEKILGPLNKDVFDKYGVIKTLENISHQSRPSIVDLGGLYIGIRKNTKTKKAQFLFMLIGMKKGYLSYRLVWKNQSTRTKNKFYDKTEAGIAYVLGEKIYFLGTHLRKFELKDTTVSSYTLAFSIDKIRKTFQLLGYYHYSDINNIEPIGFVRIDSINSVHVNVDYDFNQWSKMGIESEMPGFYGLLSWQPKTREKDHLSAASMEYTLRTFNLEVGIESIIEHLKNHQSISII